MYKSLKIDLVVVFVLLVSLLVNALTWAFQGEVFIHELDYYKQLTAQTIQQEDHQGNELSDEKSSNFSVEICLCAACQLFFFTKLPLFVPIAGKEVLANFILLQVPESFLGSPFRPP
ncbi:MAG: hypothetical protein K2Q33_07280 [Gammaproteobacteria bacterium]|nr:hypothetical protein [Gammaproteobacteria bacterium]